MATLGPDKEPGAHKKRPAGLNSQSEPADQLRSEHIGPAGDQTHLLHSGYSIQSGYDSSLYATALEDNASGSVPATKEKVSLSLYKTSEGGSTTEMEVLPAASPLGESAAVLSLDLNSQPPPPTFTSTPSRKHTPSNCNYDMTRDQVRFTASCKEGESSDESLAGSAGDLIDRADRSPLSPTQLRTSLATHYEVLDPGEISVPIRGYEIMEQRARFTVFKVQVFRSSHDSWYVFRRYTDFVQLNDKLVVLFPGFRLALPPKKWFGDNFDPEFLEDRMLGLQAFISNITGHKDVCNSQPVREFFCFDDPPGPHDSLEESRALCEALEEKLYNTSKELEECKSTISILTEERDMYRSQVTSLQSSLRQLCENYSEKLSGFRRLHVHSSFLLNNLQLDIVQRTLNSGIGGRVDGSPQSCDAALAECDQLKDAQTNGHTDSKEFCDYEASRCRSPESGIGEGIVTTPSEEGAKGVPALSS